MPDLFHVHDAAKVRVFGRAAALDGLRQPAGTLSGRIAPDEVVYVGAPGTARTLVEELESQLGGEGNAALVIDHTDGWTFYSLSGDYEEIFCRVSAIRLPEPGKGGSAAFTLGKVCDVACKLFVRPGRVDLMTGAEVRRHVEDRLNHAGHPLGLTQVSAPAVDPIGLDTGAKVRA